MTQFPSLPLFTDAFIADTSHLTAHQTGAYLMLLMMAWRMPDGRIPDDDGLLARWARVSPNAWPQTKRIVMKFWTYEENPGKTPGLGDLNEIKGFWVQKRLSKELVTVRKIAERNRLNGKQGGRPKSLKTNGHENPVGNPDGTQTKAPIPIPIKEKEKEKEMDRVWVARDTPEWLAWQNVKKQESIFSTQHQQNGWWFKTRWPSSKPTAAKEAAE